MSPLMALAVYLLVTVVVPVVAFSGLVWMVERDDRKAAKARTRFMESLLAVRH